MNPGNSGFAQICRGEYLDKTSLVERINQRISRQAISFCEVPNMIVNALHDELLSMNSEFPAEKS